MSDEKKEPLITIRVTDKERWVVEMDIDGVSSMDYAMCMLDSARRALDAKMKDEEAIVFQMKMNAAAKVEQAMKKGPLIRQ